MLKQAKWTIFFKTRETMVFQILTFDFYLEEKGNCKLLFIWLQAHHNEKISLPPTEYYALQVNLIVTLQQSDLSV